MCLQSAADKTSSHNQAQPHQLHQRVVPLFETLDDLNNAGATLARLLNTPWYRQQLRCASSCSADLRNRRILQHVGRTSQQRDCFAIVSEVS